MHENSHSVERKPDGHIAFGNERMAYWLPDGVTAEGIRISDVSERNQEKEDRAR